MKDLELIQKKVRKIPRGVPFAMNAIAHEASYANVRQVLSRLVKTGEVMRVTRGIYVRPKEVPYLGKVLPRAEEVIKVVAAQTGEIIAVHGAEAAHRLNLSTQVPLQSMYYTTGNTRSVKIGKLEVTLKHISPSKLVKPGTTTCLVISALWYLGKKEVNSAIIKKIAQRLTPEEFSEVLKHTNHMPTWMVESFEHYQRGSTHGK